MGNAEYIGDTAKRKTYENNLNVNTEPKYLCEHCNESYFGKGDLTDHNELCHGKVATKNCHDCKVVDMERNVDDLKIQISNLNTAHTSEHCNESYFLLLLCH